MVQQLRYQAMTTAVSRTSSSSNEPAQPFAAPPLVRTPPLYESLSEGLSSDHKSCKQPTVPTESRNTESDKLERVKAKNLADKLSKLTDDLSLLDEDTMARLVLNAHEKRGERTWLNTLMHELVDMPRARITQVAADGDILIKLGPIRSALAVVTAAEHTLRITGDANWAGPIRDVTNTILSTTTWVPGSSSTTTRSTSSSQAHCPGDRTSTITGKADGKNSRRKRNDFVGSLHQGPPLWQATDGSSRVAFNG